MYRASFHVRNVKECLRQKKVQLCRSMHVSRVDRWTHLHKILLKNTRIFHGP